ncbi:hypothetical protein G6F37_007931 [Rhizopus arrhizus]|nr:hypothetical protein G6F37_007931 [Rhizopus arrhizus]
MLPKVSQCTARFVYVLSPPALHQLRRNLYHVHLHYRSFQMRSLASSRALDQGVSMEDIVTMGNWAQSTTFQNHYQRNHMAQVNFTTTVLSSNDEEFFDAADTFMSLD